MTQKQKKRAYIRKVPPSCKVYTPPSLAHAMAAALSDAEGDRWLEPSIGSGALLSALRASGVSPSRIVGIDLDPAKQELDTLANVSRGVDFLSWSTTTQQRFDKIICNPPYVAIERLQSSVRRSACRIKTLDNVRVSAAANLWYAFLCAAINLLNEKGSLCFVLPAAWDFANYARPLRAKIASAFELVEVYRCGEPLFHAAEIQDGAVILVARGKLSAATDLTVPHRPMVRREFSKGSQLIRALRIAPTRAPVGTLPASSNPEASATVTKTSGTIVRLGDVVTIRLGGVTGDAKYFLLTEEERHYWNLPVAALRPVVSRAKHLQSAVVTRNQWKALLQRGERAWLFHPSPSAASHPAVQAYIKHGQRGGCDIDNHKIAARPIWYRTLLPGRIDAFTSGMSQLGPWLSFCEMPSLTASNTLYVVTFRNGDPQYRAAVALSLLSSYARDQLPALGRRYADGLIKFEPGDLREIQLLLPQAITPAKEVYRKAISKLLSGQVDVGVAIADAYCSGVSAEHLDRRAA